MKAFTNWLDSMGQDPKTVVRDVLWFAIRFYVLLYLVILPLYPAVRFLKPYFPAQPAGQPLNPAKAPPLQFFLFMAGFGIYMFFAVAIIIALLGGWFKLARKYRAPKGFKEGQLFKWQSGSVGVCNYNNVLKIRVSPQGLYLACVFPFSIMHSPILIPWDEIKGIRQKRFRRRTTTRFIVGSPKIVSVVFMNDKVVEAAKQWLPQFQFL